MSPQGPAGALKSLGVFAQPDFLCWHRDKAHLPLLAPQKDAGWDPGSCRSAQLGRPDFHPNSIKILKNSCWWCQRHNSNLLPAAGAGALPGFPNPAGILGSPSFSFTRDPLESPSGFSGIFFFFFSGFPEGKGEHWRFSVLFFGNCKMERVSFPADLWYFGVHFCGIAFEFNPW